VAQGRSPVATSIGAGFDSFLAGSQHCLRYGACMLVLSTCTQHSREKEKKKHMDVKLTREGISHGCHFAGQTGGEQEEKKKEKINNNHTFKC
jgi:hypothetical protein